MAGTAKWIGEAGLPKAAKVAMLRSRAALLRERLALLEASGPDGETTRDWLDQVEALEDRIHGIERQIREA